MAFYACKQMCTNKLSISGPSDAYKHKDCIIIYSTCSSFVGKIRLYINMLRSRQSKNMLNTYTHIMYILKLI